MNLTPAITIGLLVAGSACSSSRGISARTEATPCSLDLSYAYDDETAYWPTSPSRFHREALSYEMTHAGYFYSAFAIATPEHGGTHIDAPIHFAEGQTTTEAIPLERLIAPGESST
jgi:kynurenine formamidase